MNDYSTHDEKSLQDGEDEKSLQDREDEKSLQDREDEKLSQDLEDEKSLRDWEADKLCASHKNPVFLNWSINEPHGHGVLPKLQGRPAERIQRRGTEMDVKK